MPVRVGRGLLFTGRELLFTGRGLLFTGRGLLFIVSTVRPARGDANDGGVATDRRVCNV